MDARWWCVVGLAVVVGLLWLLDHAYRSVGAVIAADEQDEPEVDLYAVPLAVLPEPEPEAPVVQPDVVGHYFRDTDVRRCGRTIHALALDPEDPDRVTCADVDTGWEGAVRVDRLANPRRFRDLGTEFPVRPLWRDVVLTPTQTDILETILKAKEPLSSAAVANILDTWDVLDREVLVNLSVEVQDFVRYLTVDLGLYGVTFDHGKYRVPDHCAEAVKQCVQRNHLRETDRQRRAEALGV